MGNDAPSAACTRADRRLEQALRRAQLARDYRRLEAVLLGAEGQPPRAAAERVRSDVTSVRRRVAPYLATRDPGALADRPWSGGRRAAPALTRDVVTAALALNPRTLGYRATTWTVLLLVGDLATHADVAVGARTLRRGVLAYRARLLRPPAHGRGAVGVPAA